MWVNYIYIYIYIPWKMTVLVKGLTKIGQYLAKWVNTAQKLSIAVSRYSSWWWRLLCPNFFFFKSSHSANLPFLYLVSNYNLHPNSVLNLRSSCPLLIHCLDWFNCHQSFFYTLLRSIHVTYSSLLHWSVICKNIKHVGTVLLYLVIISFPFDNEIHKDD